MRHFRLRRDTQGWVHNITFPTGEEHIRLNPDKICGQTDVAIVNKNPTGDLMLLGEAVSICRDCGVRNIHLYMPFCPYARQDQSYMGGDPLSAKVFAHYINSLGLASVTIADPHSLVTPALLNNVVVIPQERVAWKAFSLLERYKGKGTVAIVAPDLGAAKKAKKLQQLAYKHGAHVPVIQCDKERDPGSGKITGFRVLDGTPTGKWCLMVDDICDGGGTFMGLADVLSQYSILGQALYVTHGIFSKGTEALRTKFDTIYTTDSLDITDQSVTVLKIEGWSSINDYDMESAR